jgi:hypothetical protein
MTLLLFLLTTFFPQPQQDINSILPKPPYVLSGMVENYRQNQMLVLAPHPVAPPLGAPMSRVIEIDNKRYRFSWDGTRATLEGEPDHPFILEPRPGKIFFQRFKHSTWAIINIIKHDGGGGWLPPGTPHGSNGDGNGEDKPPFKIGDLVRSRTHPNYGVGHVIKVKKFNNSWQVVALFYLDNETFHFSSTAEYFEKVEDVPPFQLGDSVLHKLMPRIGPGIILHIQRVLQTDSTGQQKPIWKLMVKFRDQGTFRTIMDNADLFEKAVFQEEPPFEVGNLVFLKGGPKYGDGIGMVEKIIKNIKPNGDHFWQVTVKFKVGNGFVVHVANADAFEKIN